MVALRMDEQADHPDIAVYAQHRYGELREWDGGREVPARRRAAGRLRRARLARVVLRARLPPDRGVVRPRRRQAPDEASPEARDPRPRRPGLDALAGALGRHAAAREDARVQQPDGPGRQEAVDGPDKMLDNPPAVSKRGKAAAPPDVDAVRVGRQAAHRLRRLQARPAPARVRRDGELARTSRRAAADAQRRRRRDRQRQADARRRARPAQALRRQHEHASPATRRSRRRRRSRRSCRSTSGR